MALAALACGSKGSDDGDGDDTETGGTGGTSGTGGSTGGSSGSSTGGSSGSGMLPIKQTYDFATDLGGWIFVDSSAGMIQGGPMMGETADPVPDADIMLAHTADDGEPDPGALEATIPYTMASQYVSFGVNFATDDLTGRTITARIKLVSGLGDPAALMSTPGGAKIYAKSGMSYCYANGAYNNIGDTTHPVGQWLTITYNLSRPPDYVDPACEMRGEPFDPSDVREIGIQFDSSGSAEAAETAVYHIDTVTY